MNDMESTQRLLLRYVDGRLSPEETDRVAALLRTDPDARASLREIAEQAVGVADVERTGFSQAEALNGRNDRADTRRIVRVPAWTARSRGVLAIAALFCLLGLLSVLLLPNKDAEVVRVSMVTGPVQYFGGNGSFKNELKDGAILNVGDTLETRSCNAWIEFGFEDGGALTLAGHSTLRILDDESDGRHVKLLLGNLWVVPSKGEGRQLHIHTPTVVVETRDGQLDIQTSSTDTLLRLNEGTARFRWTANGEMVELGAGEQVVLSLGRKEPGPVTPQPRPVNHWSCDMATSPDAKLLGRWLPPRQDERARLAAEPLPWPIPEREPIMLYAVALSVWKSSDRPVLLQPDSVIRVTGRTDVAQTVRFGFSTQRMQGVFAGKFEVDVAPEDLGRVGESWTVELPLSSFKPLQSGLPSFPDGLELTDIYALTVIEDAGLEINSFELVPGPPVSRP